MLSRYNIPLLSPKNITFKSLNTLFIQNSQLNCLHDASSILIRQEPHFLDAFSTSRNDNPFQFGYSIYKYNNQKEDQKLFAMKEITPPLSNYYAGKRRQINIELSIPGSFDPSPLLRFSKNLQLSFLSYNRPSLQITYLEDPRDPLILLGEISSPLSWNGYNYAILNEKFEVEYRIIAEYYQPQFYLSRLEFEQFKECTFLIFDGNDDSNSIGCIQSCFFKFKRNSLVNADLYRIQFPQNCSLESKCRLIAMTVLNDFWVFGGIPQFNVAAQLA